MAVTLEITFTGLVAFATDATNGKLFALLPTTGPLGSSGIHQHLAFLGFDRKHLPTSAASDEERGTGDRRDEHDHGGGVDAARAGEAFEHIPLGRMQLSFAGLPGTGSVVVPPTTAAPLPDFGLESLDREQVGDTPRTSVYAQVELPAAEILEPGKTARWRVGPNGSVKHYLSHQLTWKREIPADEISFTLRYLGSGVNPATVTLRGEDGDTIKIGILHVPRTQDDHPVGKDQAALHFAAYHELFLESDGAQLPHLDQNPETARLMEHERKSVGQPFGPSTFTCMTAQVPVG